MKKFLDECALDESVLDESVIGETVLDESAFFPGDIVCFAHFGSSHYFLEAVVAKARSADCLLVPLFFASLSGPQRMVSVRCSDCANRAWSSAKV